MWNYKLPDKNEKPPYLAIAGYLERDILSGEREPGSRLETHREMATKVGVTVSTITRAYVELGKRGLISSMVGRGTFVLKHKLAASLAGVPQDLVELSTPMPLVDEEPSIKPFMQKVMQDEGLDDLVKSFSPLGRHEHRAVGAGWLHRAGIDATADSVLIAGGQQHALSCILNGLFSHGDTIAVDQFTPPGFTAIVRRAGIASRGVAVDDEGMIPERLDELCAAQAIRGVYFVGNTQNPSAKPASMERLEALSKVIARYNLVVVEDGSFSVFSNRKARPLSALLHDSAVYAASLGPAIFSGLQVAFIHAPKKLYNRIAQTIMDNIVGVPPLNVAIACEVITNGALDNTLKSKQKEMKARLAVLRDVLGGFAVTWSEDSLYAWLHLPPAWKASDFERQAEKNGVKVFSVDRFMTGAFASPNCIRLAITGPSGILSLRKGLGILACMLESEGGPIPPLW